MRLQNLGLYSQFSVQCQTNENSQHSFQPYQQPALVEPRKSQIPNQIQITFNGEEGQLFEKSSITHSKAVSSVYGSPQSNKNTSRRGGFLSKQFQRNVQNGQIHIEKQGAQTSVSPDVVKSEPLKEINNGREGSFSPSHHYK